MLAQLEIHQRAGNDSCVASNGFCPSWIAHNIDRYLHPFWQHVYLSVIAVVLGFVIAFALAVLAHNRHWLVGPIIGVTGVLYTLPSIAVFFLLQPITGRGAFTALIALTAYTLLILFRNIVTGFDNVPAETVDAARGLGFTDRQVLWRVEVPLAMPEIIAGLRIASTTTVGLATLAFFAGAGGLGGEIFADITFKSNVVVAGALCLLLAIMFDVVLLTAQRIALPWQRAQTAAGPRPRRLWREARVMD
ncbi:ABC transporter permease [Capillimicrobium parvum]|uniref:Glycine betaine/carnitine/choline transport system permease protein OpuCB n=1 Tax=Capillimicrobium parvum TaxID=2884022 RepID=A0A9E6XZ25_9ACTN|nr:ABC transporter permease [Capillimicrobium parvum]UGS36653.1 Glycine betaine/carnitine/choline transport system permease protein OpuCB [Capillimicrobium parvum]